ncbi:uncharacterized protein involved in exopolysaccharide biosynthesis [Bosea sp. BK604]|nr:uncharacterized protein involved in exopolysaccharide biosynthesis [Bosea sp. BK604]
MFTIENAPGELSETKEPAGRRDAQAVPEPSKLALLTDPAWLFDTLWRRKLWIVAAVLLGAVLAALASLMIPPKYVSTAQLFIDPRDLRVLQNEVSPNAVGSDPTSITAYLESQARIIASDSIKSRVIQQEGLDKDPEFGGEATKTGLAALIADLLPSSGAPPRDGTLYALSALDKLVSVRRGERTFVIDISVTSRDATKAARIANALATAYLEDQAAVRAEAAKRATEALTARLEELRNRLRLAEDKAEKYKEANNIVGAGGKTIGEEQLALNNAQLVAVRTRVTEAKAKYDQTRAINSSSIEAGAVPEAVASNTMTALRAQLGAALGKEADLLASLGARHPALASAQAQVRDARRQINEELARINRAAKIEYDRAVEAEKQISRRVEELKSQQYAASRASVELRELEREVESSRVVYDAFLRRARETGELSGIDTTNARIISNAIPPLEKSGITRRTVVMLGGIAGGGLGALAVIGLALLGARPAPPANAFAWGLRRRRGDKSEPDESPAEAPAPASQTASVPAPFVPPQAAAAPDSIPKKAGWRRFATIQGGQAARMPDVVQAAAAPLLATLPAVRHRRWRRNDGEPRSVFQHKAHLVDVMDKPNAAFAKAVRSVRSALAKDGAQRRILVLGLRPNAGTSTLALNLALDAALEGLPAMLVDAGQGENNLTQVYAPEAQAGLHDIVSGSAGLVRVALQDEGTGLFFLPRRGRSDLVTAQQIGRDFFAAARRFGPIVVDGGPIDGDRLTQRFAEAVDDIVLVIREGATGAGDIETINAALGPNAAKIRGFVINEAG